MNRGQMRSALRSMSSCDFMVLAELFTSYKGFVPGREFECCGFDLDWLVAEQYVMPPQNHLETGYTMGLAFDALLVEKN